jgi:hypothetical protein
VVALVFSWWWLPTAFPQPDPIFMVPTVDKTWREKRLERDRVQGVANGIATTAAGFLASLLLAAFKNEIQTNVSAFAAVVVAVRGLLAESVTTDQYPAGT